LAFVSSRGAPVAVKRAACRQLNFGPLLAARGRLWAAHRIRTATRTFANPMSSYLTPDVGTNSCHAFHSPMRHPVNPKYSSKTMMVPGSTLFSKILKIDQVASKVSQSTGPRAGA